MTAPATPADPQPVYEHDCGPEHGCRFLGTIPAPADRAPAGKDVLDLWVHLGPGGRGSAIYRWDDEGSEYASLPLDTAREHYASDDRHPVIAEILRRADRMVAAEQDRQAEQDAAVAGAVDQIVAFVAEQIENSLRRMNLESCLNYRIGVAAAACPQVREDGARQQILARINALCEREQWLPLDPDFVL